MTAGRLAPWPPSTPGTLARWHRGRCWLLLVLLVASSCRDLGVATGAYATRAEAEQAGAIGKGVIPAILPKGAHDIFEAHDTSGNLPRRWGLFSFQPSDTEALQATLLKAELSLAGLRCDIPGRIEWWPVLLRGNLDAEMIKTAGLKAYATEQQDLIVVVNWNQRRAYYWTTVYSR
jgi:hypothetical protein